MTIIVTIYRDNKIEDSRNDLSGADDRKKSTVVPKTNTGKASVSD